MRARGHDGNYDRKNHERCSKLEREKPGGQHMKRFFIIFVILFIGISAVYSLDLLNINQFFELEEPEQIQYVRGVLEGYTLEYATLQNLGQLKTAELVYARAELALKDIPRVIEYLRKYQGIGFGSLSVISVIEEIGRVLTGETEGM